MKPIPKVLQVLAKAVNLIPTAVGMLGNLVGIKPTNVPIKHIGPAHQYDVYGYCLRCTRYDQKLQLYTQPPCPRIHDIDPLS